MENNQSYFDNWMKNQRDILDQWNNMSSTVREQTNMDTFFQKGQEWMNKFNQTVEDTAANGRTKMDENVNNQKEMWTKMMDNWNSWQNSLNENMMNWSKNFNDQYVNNATQNFTETAKNWQNEMMNSTQNWSKNMTGNITNPFDMPNMVNSTSHNAYKSMQSGMEAYQMMAKMWQPMFEKMNVNGWNADEFQKMVDMNQFKSYLDKVFDLNQVNINMNSLMNNWSKTMMSMNNPEMMQNIQNSMNEMVLPQMNNMSGMMQEMQKNFTAMVAPFSKLMPDDKNRQMMEKIADVSKNYTDGFQKLTELQYHIYHKGQNALDNFMKVVTEKYENGDKFKDFNDMYSEWLNQSGKSFEELFATDEYSKLQGDLVNISADIKAKNSEVMEIMMEPLPLVRKSEADEIYLSNYDLRKRIHSLEKEMEAMKTTPNHQEPMVHNPNPIHHEEATTTTPEPQEVAIKPVSNSKTAKKA